MARERARASEPHATQWLQLRYPAVLGYLASWAFDLALVRVRAGDAGPLEMLEAFLHLGEVVDIALAFLWPACAWMLDLRSCRDLPQTECREQRREERVCVPGVTQAMELMMNCHNH